MDKQMIIEFLEECENVYKTCKHDYQKSTIAVEIGQISLAINLSGNSHIIKEVIEEYKDKLTVVKYLGEVEKETIYD